MGAVRIVSLRYPWSTGVMLAGGEARGKCAADGTG